MVAIRETPPISADAEGLVDTGSVVLAEVLLGSVMSIQGP